MSLSPSSSATTTVLAADDRDAASVGRDAPDWFDAPLGSIAAALPGVPRIEPSPRAVDASLAADADLAMTQAESDVPPTSPDAQFDVDPVATQFAAVAGAL